MVPVSACPSNLPAAKSRHLGSCHLGRVLSPGCFGPSPAFPTATLLTFLTCSRSKDTIPSLSPLLIFPCLFSGLRLAEQLGRREDEAKIRHGLGLSLWASGNLEEAQHQVSRTPAWRAQSILHGCGPLLLIYKAPSLRAESLQLPRPSHPWGRLLNGFSDSGVGHCFHG